MFSSLGLTFICLSFAAAWDIVRPSNLSPPGRRSCTAWCTDDGVFHVFGGKERTSRLNDMWHFSKGEWHTQLHSFSPSKRSGSCGWSVGNTLYLFGGRDDAGNAFGDFFKFENNAWQQLSAPNTIPLYGSSCWTTTTQSKTKLYMLGGKTTNHTLVPAFFEFDVATATWTRNPDFSFEAFDDRMYSLVSTDSNSNGYLFVSNLYQFNGGDGFNAVSGSNVPRQRHDFVSWIDQKKNAVCFVTGKYIDTDTNVIGEGNACFDITTKLWTFDTYSVVPENRWGSCACISNNNKSVLLFGGADDTSKFYYSQLWKNSVAQDSVSTATDFYNAALQTGAFVLSFLCFLGILTVLVLFGIEKRRKNKVITM